MNEARMAEQMARFAISGMQTTEHTMKFMKALMMFFMKLLERDETRRLILDFYNEGLEQQSRLKPGEKLGILSYEIQPQYAKQLMDICEREKIAFMNVKLNTSNLLDYGNNEHRMTDSVLIYTTQQKEFYQAIAEAKARSGYEQEMSMEIAEGFSEKIKNINPMLQIKEMPIEKYIALRQDIQKLPQDMRFTLFPRTYEKNGQTVVDVGFLSKTEKLYNKRGNVYKEPKTYDIPEVVKGLLAKQRVLEMNAVDKDPFEAIQIKQDFKERVMSDILKNRPVTITSIKKEIDEINFDEKEKAELQQAIQDFRNKKISKDKLMEIIDKQSSLSDNAKINIKHELDNLGNETYIVPAKIIRTENDIDFQIDMKRSLCVGKDMTIREAGKDDMILDNERTIKTNLDQKLTEYAEKNQKKGEELTFVVLSAKEFNEIEKGNRDYLLTNNRLRKKNIKFLQNEENMKPYMTKDELMESEKKADLIIDAINQKKERFVLETEQVGYNIDRFDEYHESTVENIIMEEDLKIEKLEVREELREACEQMNHIEITPVGFQGNFEQYIEEEMQFAEEYKSDKEAERDYDDRREEELREDQEYYREEREDREAEEREDLY